MQHDTPAPSEAVTLDEATRSRGRLFLWLAAGGIGFAMAVQLGLNANFLASEIGITGFQNGVIEAVRETCGIWALGLLAILAGFSEPVVGMLMLMVFAVGIGAYAIVPPSFGWILAMSVVWSQGLHVWMPLPNSMGIALAEPGRKGHRLGQLGAASSAGFGIGLGAAFILSKFGVAMRPMYLVAAGAAILAGLVCLGIPRAIRTEGPRLVFRKRYGLYYALCFLEGWRKQIFICFAGFLLVRKFGAPLSEILLLWILVMVIAVVGSPRVGKLIDRIGERKILVFYFSSLVLFFLGYAFIPHRGVLYVLFVIDNAFFMLATALNTYVDRIVPAAERTPTLSMGVAFNHAAAVSMPLLGGILWEHLGYQWTFMIGAFAALCSVPVAMMIPRRSDEAGALAGAVVEAAGE